MKQQEMPYRWRLRADRPLAFAALEQEKPDKRCDRAANRGRRESPLRWRHLPRL